MSRPTATVSAEALLDHAGWVLSLARRLARDQAEAEWLPLAGDFEPSPAFEE